MIRRKLPGLQIVVLAAGFSARLGRSKALARIHGVSLLRRTVSVLAHAVEAPIVVVIAPRATRVRLELRGYPVAFLANPGRAQGLSASVALVLRSARFSSATLFLPVDLAELDAHDIARLIMRWQGARRQVVARGICGRAATPLILPKYLYPKMQGVVGDVGLRDLIAQLPIAQRTLLSLSTATRDIDTPQHLAAARQRAPRIPTTARLFKR